MPSTTSDVVQPSFDVRAPAQINQLISSLPSCRNGMHSSQCMDFVTVIEFIELNSFCCIVHVICVSAILDTRVMDCKECIGTERCMQASKADIHYALSLIYCHSITDPQLSSGRLKRLELHYTSQARINLD
jgi:hypothetical protein